MFTGGGVMSSKHLASLVKIYYGKAPCLGDKDYRPFTTPELQHVMKHNRLTGYIYKKEAFDCDDYALVLSGDMSLYAYEHGWEQGPARVILWMTYPSRHALIFVPLSEGQIVLVDATAMKIRNTNEWSGMIVGIG